MLGGLAFAFLYSTLGIPIARLADRTSRVTIIAWSLLSWSVFTALTGLFGFCPACAMVGRKPLDGPR